jgi:hypothetical protein
VTGAQLARGRARGSVGSRDGDYPGRMAGKRHHHLPAFLLRRFAERSGEREGLVWRLAKGTGQPRPVNPKREAALRHYYSLELPDGTKDTRPEEVIAAVENKAARALHAIARGETPSDEDRAWLALFVVFQHRRTPVGRSWLRFYDEKVAEMTTEVSLGNAESFRERARAADPDLTLEEIEGMRLEMLEDFEAGRISIESTPSREVAAMFLNADAIAEDLLRNFTWGVVRAPDGAELVLPGMGITLHDPTPPHPGSGLGFRSSPNAETILPVDPSFAIALLPGPPEWFDASMDEAAAEDLNLRAYAWSDAAFYGRSQKIVADVRALARRERARVGAYEPRGGTIWVTEGDGETSLEGGAHEFVGEDASGVVRRQRFFVKPGALDDARPFRG